jgi:hypothetical protein
MERQIAARIDSQAKVLYARTSDARGTTFADLVAFGERYVAESKALLLRAALIKHDMVQVGWVGVGGVGQLGRYGGEGMEGSSQGRSTCRWRG